MILAIDPGASGGIAALGSAGMEVHRMPATEGDVIALLKKWTRLADEAGNECPKVAYVEQLVHHMGAGIPASTMAVYASSWGIIMGALMMADWRVVLVTPQKWQKALGLGITGRQKADVKGLSPEAAAEEKRRVARLNADLKREFKNKLKARAQQLFPGVEVTLAISDCLLILEYARQQEGRNQ